MAIILSLYAENDLAGNPALFVMFSSLPDNENSMGLGLGPQMRRFHFTGDLIRALEPANLERRVLEGLVMGLERGKPNQLEISNEQAWNIGMLPHQDGFQWVRITIRKIETGDGSFRYCESYQVDDRTADGNVFEETLDKLETRVRQFVALDWTAVETKLERQNTWSNVLHLPDETVRYIFDGELDRMVE